MYRDPFGIIGSLIRLTVTLIVMAVALSWAAQLLAAVWDWLLLLLGLLVAGRFGLVWWRWRNQRW